MSTRDTAARVRGVSRCAKNQNRTRTRGTHFKSTAGLPAPVVNPNNTGSYAHRCYESYCWRVNGWSVEGNSTEG